MLASLRHLKRVAEYRSPRTARLIGRNLANVAVPLRPAPSGRVECVGLGFTFDPLDQPWWLDRMVVARDLVRGGWGTFGNDEEGRPEFRCPAPFCSGGELRFTPETRDDLIILDEVFLRRNYDLTPDREPFVVDVGMNVGLASLFFAGVKGWETLAFEPFPATFAAAERNLARNGLADRVHARCAAVAGQSGEVEVAENATARATNGLYGNLNSARGAGDEWTVLDLVDAAEAFREAFAMAGDRPVVAKIDAEGAEYEILDRLVETGDLGRISLLIIEYHRILAEHDPERIVALLTARGFVVHRSGNVPEAGSLVAFRGGLA